MSCVQVETFCGIRCDGDEVTVRGTLSHPKIDIKEDHPYVVHTAKLHYQGSTSLALGEKLRTTDGCVWQVEGVKEIRNRGVLHLWTTSFTKCSLVESDVYKLPRGQQCDASNTPFPLIEGYAIAVWRHSSTRVLLNDATYMQKIWRVYLPDLTVLGDQELDYVFVVGDRAYRPVDLIDVSRSRAVPYALAEALPWQPVLKS